MDMYQTTEPVEMELRQLQNRVRELERRIEGLGSQGVAVPMSPAAWVPEGFFARIAVDHADGTYSVRRLAATDRNSFMDDPDDTEMVRAGNPDERNGYAGMLEVGQIVWVAFSGLNGQNEAIYHIQ